MILFGVNNNSLNILLETFQITQVQYMFIYSSLYFRNNLTIIDAILLEGQGGRGEMKLNNRKNGLKI